MTDMALALAVQGLCAALVALVALVVYVRRGRRPA